jgi:protoheme IX farnesyltransferase
VVYCNVCLFNSSARDNGAAPRGRTHGRRRGRGFLDGKFSLNSTNLGKHARRAHFWTTVCASAPDFWTLTKPEVNFLIVIATFTGFHLGYPTNLHGFPLARLFHTLSGTLLVASGAGTLNQYLEYLFDAQMRRTSRRPIAAGRLRPETALWFGVSLSIAGVVYLLVAVNALSSLLAAVTSMSYLFVYTPLKRETPFCTFAGAVPGAMPTLIGWAAASDSIISGEAWMLYALLFSWQLPHFMVIAWMYRDDYARAGYLIFPTNNEGTFMARVTSIASFALFIASFGVVSANNGGTFQYSGTVLLGCGLLYCALRQVSLQSRIGARHLFLRLLVFIEQKGL